MNPESFKRWTLMSLLALLVMVPSLVEAEVSFSRIVVFGTSLSDSGNAFALTGQASTPPYDSLDPFLVPDAPYAKGGHHLSNGATWVEQFARPLGLAGSVRPAFQSSNPNATNYAVGAARAREAGFNDLSDQVSMFLSDFGGVAPSDALYVIEMGSNDVRDALVALGSGGDAGAIINAAIGAIGDSITALYAAGARNFIVANVPNLGLLPAVRILDGISPGSAAAAGLLSQSFNLALNTLLGFLSGLPDIEIAVLDIFQVVNALVATPEAFGLTEVQQACVTPNIPPFACQNPDEFLFWDGIHPTEAVHGIFAQEAAAVLNL
jgi:phospholipase/lecithinase/hemolysin